MTKKQKLGRTWIGKDNRLKLEPWILLEDAGTRASCPQASADGTSTLQADLFDNRPKLEPSFSASSVLLIPGSDP